MVQLQHNLGQKLCYYNPWRLLQRGQSPAFYGATYIAKKYILPSQKDSNSQLLLPD